MVEENYESHRKRYLQAMFGTRSPKPESIKAALDRAHEIRQFEIRLYWHRSLFFWGFVLTLFAGLGLMLTAEKQTALTKLMSVGIVALGFFTTCAWYYIEQGSKAWQANWELHIDCLEDGITGKLYKARLWLDDKDNFFSVSKITQTVIIAFGIFWLLASVFVTLNTFLTKKQERALYSILAPYFDCIIEFFEDRPWISVLISILVPLLICMFALAFAYRKKFWPLGYWRSTDNKEFSETVWFSERARKFEIKK